MLNEELGIKKVVEDMPKGLVVWVVDGDSTDKTIEVAEQCQATMSGYSDKAEVRGRLKLLMHLEMKKIKRKVKNSLANFILPV